MDNLKEFKDFVKENPNLLHYVSNGEMTWQKFYEMYDMYGASADIWEKYLNVVEEKVTEKPISTLAISDLIAWFKELDISKMQEGINSMQRVISVLQDLGNGDTVTDEYKPRPIYKHFED